VSADIAMQLRRLTVTLPAFQYRFADEVTLHEGIAGVLDEAKIPYQREFVAGPRDRFDFLVAPWIVVEAKIKGSLSQALTQVDRYAARADVHAVVLVTTRFWGNVSTQIEQLHGKPVRVLKLRGASF
jgi:hypothetical protein